MTALAKREKTVRWVELFFDLIFVAAAHEVTATLQNLDSIRSAAPHLLLFFAMLLLWLGHTLYSSRFAHRGLLYNINTILSMGFIFALTIMMHGAYAEYLFAFSITFALAKASLILFYLEALLRNPLRVLYLLPLLIGYTASTILWAYSPFVSHTFLFWALALAIDFFAPLYSRILLRQLEINPHHLPERLGLLAVIMLGEIIISLVGNAHKITLGEDHIVALGLGLTVVGLVFWSYFRFVEKHIVATELTNTSRYTYAHIPLYISLLLFASSIKATLFDKPILWQFILGIVLFIISYRMIKYTYEGYIPSRQLVAFILFGTSTLIVLFTPLSMTEQNSIIMMLFIAYMFISEFILTIFANRPSINRNNSIWN